MEAAGEVTFTATEVQDANAHARLSFDTEEPTLRLNLPGDLNTHLRGKAALLANMETRAGVHHLIADLHETRFEVYGMPVKGFHVDTRYAPKTQAIDVRRVRLRLAQGDLDLEAHVELGGEDHVVAGEHDITLKLRDFPVRALARQFVGLPQLLPDGLSLTVRSQGRALYPPTSEVLVDVVPEGLPGEDWPGLPHSMELRGRFLTHPDLVEVLKLEVAVEHVPSFAIQGALPLQQQSFIDLIQAIHQVNPKGPLRRVPAAPSSSEAL